MHFGNKTEEDDTVGAFLKSNSKIVERGTSLHDRLISWHGTGTSIKSGGVKLVLWTQRTYLGNKT